MVSAIDKISVVCAQMTALNVRRREASIERELDIFVFGVAHAATCSLGSRHEAEQSGQIDIVVAALVQHGIDVSLDFAEHCAVRHVFEVSPLLVLHGSRRFELSQVLLHVEESLQIAQRIVHLSLVAGSSDARLAAGHVTARSDQELASRVLAHVVSALIVALVVHRLQLFDEEAHAVFDVSLRHLLLALGADVGRELLLLFVVDGRHVEGVTAVRANNFESGDGTTRQSVTGLSLHDGSGDRGKRLIVIVRSRSLVVLVLLLVDAEALGDEVRLDTVNMLNQTSDWREKLLSDVPVVVDDESASLTLLLHVLFRAVSHVAQAGLFVVVFNDGLAYDVWHEAVDKLSVRLALLLLAKRNLHVRQSLRVRVVFRASRQLLRNDELTQRDVAVLEVFTDLRQVLIEGQKNLVALLARKDLREDFLTDGLRERAPVTTNHVETLDLARDFFVFRAIVLDGERGVLLLLEQKHALEDAINFNLKALVKLVDLGLELLALHESIFHLRRASVDHDGIGITIDDSEAKLRLGDILGAHQSLSTSPGNQRCDGLSMESRRRETKATIHTVSGELERSLSDVQLLVFDRVLLALHLLLDGSSFGDQSLQNVGQDGVFGSSKSRGHLNFFLLVLLFIFITEVKLCRLHSAAIKVTSGLALDSREAQVVLLDDGRIKRVEIEHHDDVVVEARLWVEDETTTILGLLALAFDDLRFFTVLTFFFGELTLLGRKSLLVGANKLAASELVQQQHLITLGTSILQTTVPQVTGDASKLLRERQDVQMHHELVSEERVSLSVLNKPEDLVRTHVERREHVLVKVLALRFQLLLSEVREIVVGFTNQLFGTQEGIDEQTTAAGHARKPGAASVATLLSTAVRNVLSLESTDTRPVRHLQVLDTRQDDLEDTAAKTMRNKDIGINLKDARNQSLHQLLLIVEHLHASARGILLEALLQVVRPGFSVELSDQTELLHGTIVIGGTVLIDCVLDHARDHGDFVGVIGRASGLEREGDGRQGRCLAVQLLQGNLNILGAVDGDLMTRPGLLVVHVDLGALDAQPARALDLPLEDEQLKHALLRAKNALESVTLQARRQRRILRRVLHLEELVFTVRNGQLEGVLARHKLALEVADLLELTLLHLSELHDHAVLQCLLLFLRHGAAIFRLLGIEVDDSLHAIDLERARNEALGLWLPNLTEEEYL